MDMLAHDAEMLYNAYNAGGDPAPATLNYQGKPCPAWDDLPENIQNKWKSVTLKAIGLYNHV